MKTSTSRWNRTKTASRNDRASRARRRALFNYEPLEQRALLTAFVINGDQSGANVDDIITIDLHGEWGSYSVNGVDGTFLPGAIDQVIVNPGGGHNIINILNTEVEAPVTVNPGGGLDEVNVGNSVDGVQGIHGAVNIGDLGSGQTVLFVDNSVDSENQTVDFYDGQITGIAPAPINFSTNPNTDVPGMGELGIYVDGASGNSTFNIHDTSVLGRNGGTLLQTGGGEDTVNVLGTTGYLTVRNQGGLDTTTIGAAGSLGAIKGQVWVGGGDGPTAVTNLSLDDSADPAASAIEMYSDHVTGIAPATIGWTPRMDPFTGGVYSLNVSCGNGGNTINVHDTSGRGQDGASYVYNRNRISTGTGNDTVNIQGTTGHLIVFNPGGHDTTTIGAGGSLANIHSGVIVNSDTANGADVALTIGNTSDTASTMFEVGIGHSPDNPQAAGYVVLDDSVPISWDVFGSPLGVTSLNLKTGVKSDYLRITGTSVPLSVYNAGGEDVVYIGTGSMTSIGTGSMTSITAPINLQGEGDTLLYLDDRADPTASTIDLYNGSITGIAPAAITWTPKSNSTGGVTNIFVYGGSGDNTYFVHDTGDFNNYANSFFGSGRTELDTGPGNDRVNVLGTTGSLFVNNTGGQDQVGVGGIWAGGSMANIKGNVYVYGVGDTALSLDDSSDTTPSTIDFYNDPSAYWGWVTGLAPGRIQWSATSASTGGVTYLGVQAGSGGDTINVHDTSAFLNGMDLKPGSNASVNILGTNGKLNVIDDSFNDTIVVGNTAQGHFDPGQGTLRAINGPISISGAGSTSLAIDGNDATARTATLTSSSLVGLAPGSITFGSAVNALSIWCGANVGFTVSSMPAIPLSVVSGPNSTLIAPDTSNYWSFDSGNFSINAGSFGHLSFGGFDKLVGGMEDDHFYFQDPNMSIVQVSIDGGGGANTLSYNQAKYGSVFVNLANSTATSILGTVTDIQNFTGGNTPGLFFGPDGGSTFNITGTNMGNVAGVSFTGFGTLFGGTGNDVFVLRNGASVTGFVQGQGGTNTLDLSAYTTPTSVNLAASQATGVGGTFANIQTVIGGTNAANTLFGPTAATTYSITGQNTGIVNGLSFSHFGNITAGPGNDRFVFSDAATLSGALSGGAGSNTIDESAYSTTVAANLSAKTITGVGTNYSSIQTFIAGTNAGGVLTGPATSSAYNVTGINAVTVAGLTYNNFSSLIGGAGNDLFLFSPGASLGGSINGGLGNNSINESSYTIPVTLNLAAGTVTGLGAPFSNILTVTAGRGANTLMGPDTSATYRITGTNAGNVGTFNFTNFANLTAGSADDVFKFTSAGAISGKIDGGGGTNTIDETLLTTPVTLNLAASTVSQLTGTFTNIQTVLAGGNSANQILGPSTDSTFNITGTNAGIIAGLSFRSFGNLIGGAGNDTFTFGPSATLVGRLDGGAGTNTLDYSSLTSAVTLNLPLSTATDIRKTFANIQSVIGGTNAANTLFGPTAATTYSITGQNTGIVNGLSFSHFGNITAGPGNDRFVFSDAATLSGALSGGAGSNTIDESAYSTTVAANLSAKTITGVGTNYSSIQTFIAGTNAGGTLTGPATSSNYYVTGLNAVTVAGLTYNNFSSLTGGAGNDLFLFSPGASLGGSINGGLGNNSINESDYITPVALNLAAGTITGLGSPYANIRTITGGSGANTLIGPDASSTYRITGPNVGNVGTFNFANFGSLTAGSANDVFKFTSAGTITGNIDGGGGSNTIDETLLTTPVTLNVSASTVSQLTGTFTNIQTVLAGGNSANQILGPSTDSTFNITGTNAGNIAGLSFSGFGNLTGGTGNDTFTFGPAATLLGNLDGGTGINTLDYSSLSTVVTLNLVNGTASDIRGTFANIQNVNGGTNTTNLLTGPATGSTYQIVGRNTGSVNGFVFRGFGSIVAGAGDDATVFSDGALLTGSLNLGLGANTLDESAYTTGITVNLATGRATGVGGTISNIQYVRGGSGNDVLTGNSVGDVLIGGAGNDTLIGGSGRSLLIGGTGVDNVTGGSGDDIIIGGSTSFDNNNDALKSILAEWQSADSYAARLNFLKNGGGLNGTNVLILGTTVVNDSGTNVLIGGGGNDWLLTFPPTVSTQGALSVTASGATLTGVVNPNGYPRNVSFQYSTDPTFAPTVQMAFPAVTYNGPSSATDDVAVDAAGNVYVTDYKNNRVRELLTDGTIRTIGTGFVHPTGVAVDAAGNVYVADYSVNGDVKEVMAGSGKIVTLASGIYNLTRIAVDGMGNVFVVASNGGVVLEIIAGTSTIKTIGFAHPNDVAVDAAGNIFVADPVNRAVYERMAGTSIDKPIGSGFLEPYGVAVDSAGNVFVGDVGRNALFEVMAGTGTIITLSTGGYPASIAVNGVGDVFVLGDDDGASYELSPPTVSAAPASVSGSTDTAISATLYGLAPATTYYYRAVIGGFATGSTFSFTTLAPPTVTTTAADSVTTSGANLNGTVNANGGMSNVVFQYSTSPTLSPTVQSAVPGALYGQDSVAVDGAGNVFVLGFHNTIDEIMAGTGIIKTIQPTASLGDANSIAVDGAGNVFVADYTNNAVREVMAGTGITKTIAQVYQPWAVAADAAGHVYVTSQHGRTTGDWDIYGLVYEIDANTGSYVGGASGFISPRGIAVDAAGNLYVPDEGNRAVYEVMAGTKTKVTIASAINAQGVAVDGLGNVFISDGQTVREIIAGTGTVVPIGSGFSNPQGLAVDAAGNVFVANYIGNSGVVEVSIPTIAATPGTVSGVADTTVSAALSGLTPGTTYYYRAIASGGVMGGDAVGSIQSFTTAASGGSPGNGDGPPPPTVNVASARFEPGTADARSIPTIAKIGSEPTVAVSNNNAAVHDEAIESMFAVGVQDDSDSFLFRRSGGRSSGLSLRKA